MEEVLMEMNLLRKKMEEVNAENEELIGNDSLPFAKVLYAITSKIDKKVLFEMTDSELINYIRKVQLIES